MLPDDDVYHSLLRPEAGRILEGLRDIGRVRMLTTAVDAYARAHNKAFSLGFREDEIIARESYITKVQVAYGTDWIPSATKTDPEAALIDNLSPSTESSRTKRAFLGIGEDGYFQIREFDGKDPECFGSEVDRLLESIALRASAMRQAGTGRNQPAQRVARRPDGATMRACGRVTGGI